MIHCYVSSSRICQASSFPRQSSCESHPTLQVNNEKDIDDLNLSISAGSLDISNAHFNILESKPDSQINTISVDQLDDNQSSTFSLNSKQFEGVVETADGSESSDDSDERDHKAEVLMESDDEESSGEVEAEVEDDDLFDNVTNRTDRQFTSKEISLCLSLLQSRHSLTNACLTNICRLLKVLRVPNSPSNFRHVRSLICNPYKSMISGKTMVSCPSCSKISSDSSKCTSSPTCPSREKFVANPTMNYTLCIEPQIRAALERNRLLKPVNDDNRITDIMDAPLYRKILREEAHPFITLLMNSDGAVVKSISRSIWVTTFVINELPPSVRFNRENIIIGMISVGSVKPTKQEMQIFLAELVKELLYLEKNGLQYHPFNSSLHMEEIVRVFLIAASCDMPASSLIINHTEASGYYGCIHCKITGT